MTTQWGQMAHKNQLAKITHSNSIHSTNIFNISFEFQNLDTPYQHITAKKPTSQSLLTAQN
jgi:hypothetical protein